jgi:hypothetical protein
MAQYIFQMLYLINLTEMGLAMNTETFSILISVISASIALLSVIFARKTVQRADKTLSMNVITQIFNTYSSAAMNADQVEVWRIYLHLWQEVYPDDTEAASAKMLHGEPVPPEEARQFMDEIDPESPQFKALDSVSLFWSYVALLISQDILKIEQLGVFMTPRILGVLYPIEKAKAEKYGYGVEQKSSLQTLYERWKRKYPNMY